MENVTQGTLSSAGTPSGPGMVDSSGDLIKTVERSIPTPAEKVTPVEEGQPAKEGVATKEDADKKAQEEADKKAREEAERFDKHPRFQELIKEKNEFRDRLIAAEGKIEAFSKGAQVEPEEEHLDFQDMSGMTDEELAELQSEKPREFLSNLAKQLRHELRKEFQSEFKTQTKEERVNETFQKYAKDNPDFEPMWKSGEIRRFMDENPGHNALSAHQVLTSQKKDGDIQKRIDVAVEKAKKETEDRILADIKAKGGARVLGAGPSSANRILSDEAPELKDPKKFGGVTAVLAARSKERMRQRQAGG